MKEAKTENKMQINLPYCSHSKVEMNAKSSLAKKKTGNWLRKTFAVSDILIIKLKNKVMEYSFPIFAGKNSL